MHTRTFLKLLGDEVRKRRLECDHKQEKAAEACRVHVNSLKLLERGIRDSQVETLAKIAMGLHIPLSELIARVEQRPEYVGALLRLRKESTL